MTSLLRNLTRELDVYQLSNSPLQHFERDGSWVYAPQLWLCWSLETLRTCHVVTNQMFLKILSFLNLKVSVPSLTSQLLLRFSCLSD